MKTTQKQRVLDYIERYGSITAFEAVKDLGILQLAARLTELKDEGYVFRKKQESALNRFGERIYYIRYSLEGGESE